METNKLGNMSINDNVVTSLACLSGYAKIDYESENTISSYNEFTARSTFFELDGGPQIGLNVDRNVDVRIGGKNYIMPDTDYGPGHGILSDELSVVKGEDSDQLTAELIATRSWPNLVTKTNGGSITADVGIVQHNLNILSGNYVQTSIPDSVVNYASKNAFLQADVDPKYGNSYTGTKAFCVLQVISAANQIRLSGDISELKAIADGNRTIGDYGIDISKSRSLRRVFGLSIDPNDISLSSGINMSAAAFSMTVDSYSTSMGLHLSSVDADTGIVTLAEPLGSFNSYDNKNEQWFIDAFKDDDNAFYLVGFPEIGNLSVETNFGQYAQGGSVRAIGRETHAEGRDNVADIRYAHVEGSHNIAGDMAAHAEGFRTYAVGRYSHAEGITTEAHGQASHAEGRLTYAQGTCAHAEGHDCKTIPNPNNANECGYGHAEGYRTTAGYVAHAECWQTSALGNGSHTEGHLTKAIGVYSHAEGDNTVATANSAHAEGNAVSATFFASHAEGYKTWAGQVGAHAEGGYYLSETNKIQGGRCIHSAHGAHAEGLSTFVDNGIGAHAEGCGCVASGTGAHAEGGYWASNKVWEGTLASGKGSHSEGCATVASGKGAHAEGNGTTATGDGSHAAGRRATAENDYQFVWNGIDADYDPSTSGAGAGTFCINPTNNLSGFYIGQDNFIQCVLSAVQSMDETQKIALKAALGL